MPELDPTQLTISGAALGLIGFLVRWIVRDSRRQIDHWRTERDHWRALAEKMVDTAHEQVEQNRELIEQGRIFRAALEHGRRDSS